jgi:hypothetical protein
MNKLCYLVLTVFLSITVCLFGQRQLPIGITLTQGTLYNEITEGVAYRLKFWTLYRELRSAAYNQLDRLIKATEKKVADLLFEYNDHHAAMVKRSMGYYYDRLSRDFDNIFEAIDMRIIYKGAALDYHSAPLEEKEQFVNKAKIDLKKSVTALLNESSQMISKLLA